MLPFPPKDKLVHNLTNKFNGLVQPGKELLTVIVIDRNAHEVAVTDEIRLGAGVAGIEDVAYPILGHQVLNTSEKHNVGTSVQCCCLRPKKESKGSAATVGKAGLP